MPRCEILQLTHDLPQLRAAGACTFCGAITVKRATAQRPRRVDAAALLAIEQRTHALFLTRQRDRQRTFVIGQWSTTLRERATDRSDLDARHVRLSARDAEAATLGAARALPVCVERIHARVERLELSEKTSVSA